eukprot:PhM_4_TR2087/c4_g1_i5/m.91444
MNKSGITDTHSHTLVKASPHISQTFRQLSCEPAGGAGAQIPLGDASSSSEDETIGDMQARQQHQATPDHVVVEADLPTRHITLDDIKSIGISVKHPQLQRWAQATLREVKLAEDSDMAMVNAEWESLTAVQQKARATEFAKRRQRAKWTKTDIGLLLKRAR